MNFLLITLLAIGTASFFPRSVHGASSSSDKQDTDEVPRALPLTAAASGVAAAPQAAAAAGIQNAKQIVTGEIWQEDDHEILIRSERGVKNNNGGSSTSSSGKEKKSKRVNNNNAHSKKIAEPKNEPKTETKIEHNDKNEHKNEHRHRLLKKPSKFFVLFSFYFLIYLS